MTTKKTKNLNDLIIYKKTFLKQNKVSNYE